MLNSESAARVMGIPVKALLLSGALIAVTVTLTPLRPSESQDHLVREDWRRHEVARIQEHLAGAERLLLAADVHHLTFSQLEHRRRNIALLSEYREHGVFPHNTDFPGERRPYFVDARGVHCAMAHLIARSGREDIVERVHAGQNNAYVRDLAADTALVAWLGSSGLSLDEAARIQPAYESEFEEPPSNISADFAVASTSAGLLNGMVIVWNLTAPTKPEVPRWRGLVGLLTGGAAVALGVSHLDDGGDAETLGIWNTAIGAATIGVGGFTLLRRGESEESLSPFEGAHSSRGSVLSLRPVFGQASGAQLLFEF